ncbi:hypothetical protein [Faecalibacillus intestinalis]|uniref:hypothetical protein n=1 Tax=Faecalibacillus intestinalis TaxID=1982626 RepID=UPI0039923E4D
MVNLNKIFIDAIETLIDAKVRKNTTQIYTGLVVLEDGEKKVKVKDKIYKLPVYGGNIGDLVTNQTVKVFIPQGQMSQGFILALK